MAALQRPGLLRDDGAPSTLIETHISYVLLAGGIAYKIKKAVALPFLDFRPLEARRFYCEEEVRLNRRLAPWLYLGVVAFTGDVDHPAVDGDGPVLDYAVKMREFPPDALLSLAIRHGGVGPADIDAIAACVARFHASASAAKAANEHGRPDQVLHDAIANFEALRSLAVRVADVAALDRLQAWTEAEFGRRAARIEARRIAGRVRECHGDLHLGNIAHVDGKIVVFDCLEFNERMRWTDVASDVAFLTMDLHDHRRSDLAHRFRNAWLEATGDYDALCVLRFFEVYRAMVRAKVAAFRAEQLSNPDERRHELAHDREYVRLAGALAKPGRPAMIITHGLSGSGKTTITQRLLETVGGVRIRTDVERKRLAEQSHGKDALYGDACTRRTYDHVLALATQALEADEVAIVDGAFLLRWQRDVFRERARARKVPFVVLDVQADIATMRGRLRVRSGLGRDASDADESVLERQLETREPLGADERNDVVTVDANLAVDRQLELPGVRRLTRMFARHR